MFARPGLCGTGIGRLGLVAASQPSLVAQALSILAKYGAAANLYLPGVGAISGITAGNWLDSAGTTAATVDNPVGLVVNARGGAHLTQATTANRPILRRGLVNYMTQSQFATGWSVVGSDIIAQNQPSPTGQNNAVKLVMSAVTSRHGIFRATSVSETTGAVLSVSVFAKADGLSKLSISNGGTISFHAVFDLANQTHGNRPGQTLQVTTSMQSVGNGWFRCGFTYTATGNIGIALSFSGYSTQPLDHYGVSGGAGNGVDGILLFGAQTELASSIGEYVATTTAPASSTNGPFAWQFDGSNDSFTSTMTPGNAGFFCAAANVTDSGVLRTLLGAGAGSDASSGVWLARAASNALTLQVGNGTTRNSVSAAYPVATNAVASAGWDASNMFVGINGTETSVAKSVNCTSANTMNVGVLTGTTNPMLGTISGGAIIMPTVLPTASERSILRQLIASLSGVTL